jgi:NADH-quinone oxidoreductase subunit G
VVTIEVCVGSSCYLRGAPEVIARFERLIAEDPGAQVVLKGSFCMERCTDGVSVRIDGRVISGVHAEDVSRLYEQHVQSRLVPKNPDGSE